MQRWRRLPIPAPRQPRNSIAQLFGELAEAERKAAGFSDDLLKAEQRTKLQNLDRAG